MAYLKSPAWYDSMGTSFGPTKIAYREARSLATEQDYSYVFDPDAPTWMNVARSMRMDRIRADLANERRSELLRKRSPTGRGSASGIVPETRKEVN